VDAVLITCSTMNRAYPLIQSALQEHSIPVLQIDRPMMERAVMHGRPVLVLATHGPTVENTQLLLREVAQELSREVSYTGDLVEEAWHCLARGDMIGHNAVIAAAIRKSQEQDPVGCVVLAQLSMSAFLLSYPDPLAEFGVPVYTSGQCGFEAVRDLWIPNVSHDQ
jgi:aspartate/glutamate racemase